MTQGTSTHGDGLSVHWADAMRESAGRAWRRIRGAGWRIDGARAAEGTAASLQLLALSASGGLVLGLLLNVSWPGAVEGGSVLLHLAALAATGVIAAIVALRSGEPAPLRQDHSSAEPPSRLLAQMHHELRTPLNAIIGFSEAMLRELHGPLGHARYQEYVAHISESGGRLLKASEDALAVAATMSALMADRRALQRERLPAVALLQAAWATSEVPDRNIRLSIEGGGAAEIQCDRQAMTEALQYLLAEAAARVSPGGAIAVTSGPSRIGIAVDAGQAAHGRVDGRPSAPGDGLRLMLARSLVEMQGATLSVDSGPDAEAWTARIIFPAPTHARTRQCRTPAIAGAAPPLPCPARRADFAAGAAIRASAGSHAAPPA